MRLWCIVLLCGCLARAEVIDRIAVVLDKRIITRSAMEGQVRVTAFLAREPLEMSAKTLRRAAERMIEQALVQQEMEFSRYTMPMEEEAEATRAKIQAAHFATETEFFRDLASYGLTAKDLRGQLLRILAMDRFVQLRFRPSVAVGDGEIEIYYREQFVPQWERAHPDMPAPPVEEARDQIVEALMQQKTDTALNLWLNDARGQVRVRFFEEAFQ